MDFSLTPRQKLVQKLTRKFASEYLEPRAAVIDLEHRFDQEAAKVLGEIGAWGIQISPKFSGAGLDSISYAIVIEEISRACASTGLNVTVHNSVCAAPIEKWGTPEQRERFLPDLASGRKIGAYSLTEPNAGSDVAGIQTVAELDGDEYLINGNKIFVTNGGVAEVVLIGATTDPKLPLHKSFGLFIMEQGMPGFSVGKLEDKMGMRGSSTTELVFKDCRVPKENVLGNPGEGFGIAMKILDMGRIGIAAQALGIGQAAYEAALKFSKARQQFGRPISAFQAISFKLADMALELNAARLLIWQACDRKDKGLPFTTEAAMAKYYASNRAMNICTEAIQIHGGYGYMRELPLERYFRDVKVTEIYEGTSEIMKLIIANNLLKEA
ncbi:MAG TPA: acyl-CoA dehydrogenase family protein [Candidatus Lokiarchaeia archaeon]|nr:acyl-CoA dehydrogenase family protein [Candidatus Lokiarchaeia archaeon]